MKFRRKFPLDVPSRYYRNYRLAAAGAISCSPKQRRIFHAAPVTRTSNPTADCDLSDFQRSEVIVSPGREIHSRRRMESGEPLSKTQAAFVKKMEREKLARMGALNGLKAKNRRLGAVILSGVFGICKVAIDLRSAIAFPDFHENRNLRFSVNCSVSPSNLPDLPPAPPTLHADFYSMYAVKQESFLDELDK